MQNRQFTLLTYNVWDKNDVYPDHQKRLIAYMNEQSADIVCLQEVTQHFYKQMMAAKFDQTYDFVDAKALTEDGAFRGDLLMIKKHYHAQLFSQEKLQATTKERYMAYGVMTIDDVKISVATAHLESEFFDAKATQMKTRQLAQICDRLEETKPDCFIMAGDCNFTSGDQLDLENAAINDLQLTDAWKVKNVTTEDENDEKYRQNDVTWDSANNPNVTYEGEFHRPDRVFMRFFKPQVKLEGIERVVSDMSDHYGLKAVFSLST